MNLLRAAHDSQLSNCRRLPLVLDRTGHAVTAIDPRASEVPVFRRVRIEESSESGPFDHVVAILSLYHVEGRGDALNKIVEILRTGPTLVVVEFAVGSDSTGRWPNGHWHASPTTLLRESTRG